MSEVVEQQIDVDEDLAVGGIPNEHFRPDSEGEFGYERENAVVSSGATPDIQELVAGYLENGWTEEENPPSMDEDLLIEDDWHINAAEGSLYEAGQHNLSEQIRESGTAEQKDRHDKVMSDLQGGGISIVSEEQNGKLYTTIFFLEGNVIHHLVFSKNAEEKPDQTQPDDADDTEPATSNFGLFSNPDAATSQEPNHQEQPAWSFFGSTAQQSEPIVIDFTQLIDDFDAGDDYVIPQEQEVTAKLQNFGPVNSPEEKIAAETQLEADGFVIDYTQLAENEPAVIDFAEQVSDDLDTGEEYTAPAMSAENQQLQPDDLETPNPAEPVPNDDLDAGDDYKSLFDLSPSLSRLVSDESERASPGERDGGKVEMVEPHAPNGFKDLDSAAEAPQNFNPDVPSDDLDAGEDYVVPAIAEPPLMSQIEPAPVVANEQPYILNDFDTDEDYILSPQEIISDPEEENLTGPVVGTEISSPVAEDVEVLSDSEDLDPSLALPWRGEGGQRPEEVEPRQANQVQAEFINDINDLDLTFREESIKATADNNFTNIEKTLILENRDDTLKSNNIKGENIDLSSGEETTAVESNTFDDLDGGEEYFAPPVTIAETKPENPAPIIELEENFITPVVDTKNPSPVVEILNADELTIESEILSDDDYRDLSSNLSPSPGERDDLPEVSPESEDLGISIIQLGESEKTNQEIKITQPQPDLVEELVTKVLETAKIIQPRAEKPEPAIQIVQIERKAPAKAQPAEKPQPEKITKPAEDKHEPPLMVGMPARGLPLPEVVKPAKISLEKPVPPEPQKMEQQPVEDEPEPEVNNNLENAQSQIAVVATEIEKTEDIQTDSGISVVKATESKVTEKSGRETLAKQIEISHKQVTNAQRAEHIKTTFVPERNNRNRPMLVEHTPAEKSLETKNGIELVKTEPKRERETPLSWRGPLRLVGDEARERGREVARVALEKQTAFETGISLIRVEKNDVASRPDALEKKSIILESKTNPKPASLHEGKETRQSPRARGFTLNTDEENEPITLTFEQPLMIAA